jgi:hypothetical protein
LHELIWAKKTQTAHPTAQAGAKNRKVDRVQYILKKGINWTKRETFHNLSKPLWYEINRKGAAPQEIQVMAMLSIYSLIFQVELRLLMQRRMTG